MHKLLLSTIKQQVSSYALSSHNTIAEKCLEHAMHLNKSLNSFTKVVNCATQKHGGAGASHLPIFSETNKYLNGIPFALKDNFCTKGINTTCGSEMLRNFVPTYNATVYDRLLNAGAILIGKCNLDQFGMGSGCVDSIFGPTLNVWGYSLEELKNNTGNWRISGGSSGGSAIAVASGACTFALGSDTGGSTRNPASYCGVVGFKPTYGLVSRHGLIPLVNSMDVPGILTRSVEDCVTVLNCIAGPDEMDSTTIKTPFNNIVISKKSDVKGLRVGIPKEYHCSGMSSEIVSAWTKIADLMEDAGAIVTQVSMPNTSASIAVYSILNQCEVSSNMARFDGVEYGLRPKSTGSDAPLESMEKLYAESRSQGFNNVVKNRILAGNYFLLEGNYEKYFLKAMKVRRLIANDFHKVFNGDQAVDILLTPTTLTEAPTYSEFIEKENRDQCSIQDYCTQPANMAGVPAISLPIMLSTNELPLSIQLMGPQLSEEKLLNAALWIESAVDFQNTYAELLNQRIEMLSSVS